MKKKTNKRMDRKNKQKSFMESAESLNSYETENETEDLRYSEVFRDCFNENGDEDKNVMTGSGFFREIQQFELTLGVIFK